MIRKIGFYILSLWLLFLLIIIITIEIPIYFGEEWAFVGFKYLITHNVVPIICVILLIIGSLSYFDFKHKTKGTPELSFEITEIENINYESLTFLTTYIIPLVCFNFDNLRQEIVLLILLVVIGMIYIRTGLFYSNPTLAILQFRVYKINGIFRGKITKSGVILIAREDLHKKDKIKYFKLDENIFYAIKTKQL